MKCSHNSFVAERGLRDDNTRTRLHSSSSSTFWVEASRATKDGRE